MIKKSGGTWTVTFPRHVFASTLNQIVESLPITNSTVIHQNEQFVGRAEWSPHVGLKRIEFDTTAIHSITAGAATRIYALRRWLREQQSGIEVTVIAKRSGRRTASLLERESEDLETEFLKAQLQRPKPAADMGLIALVRGEVTSTHDAEPSTASGSSQCYSFAQQFLAYAKESNGLLRELEPEVERWFIETIAEGLLNVSQHANEVLGLRAFFACAVSSVPASTLLGDPDLSRRESDEAQWLSKLAEQRGRVLELSIVDVGLGIPQGLTNIFLKANPEFTEHNGESWWNRTKILHDATLFWALTPFGTRKSAHAKSTSSKASTPSDSWRGLYRVLYRTRMLFGTGGITSGAGTYCGTTEFGDGSSTFKLATKTKNSVKAVP